MGASTSCAADHSCTAIVVVASPSPGGSEPRACTRREGFYPQVLMTMMVVVVVVWEHGRNHPPAKKDVNEPFGTDFFFHLVHVKSGRSR